MKADDYGRFSGNPKLLKSLLFPLKDGVRDTDCSRWLTECETAGLLAVYHVGGKPFIEIRKFNQRLRSKVSRFPAPDQDQRQAMAECQPKGGQCADTCPTNDRMLLTHDGELPSNDRHVTARREVEVEEKKKRRTDFINAPNGGVDGERAERIYQAYPRHVGRPVALKAITRALQKQTFENLLQKTQQFAQSPAGQAGRFCPHPATWFNQERYNDDPAEWHRTSQRNDDSPARVRERGLAGDYSEENIARIRAARLAGFTPMDGPPPDEQPLEPH